MQFLCLFCDYLLFFVIIYDYYVYENSYLWLLIIISDYFDDYLWLFVIIVFM